MAARFSAVRPDGPSALTGASRWLYVPLYGLLGLSAFAFLPQLRAGAPDDVVGLLFAGASPTASALSSTCCSSRSSGPEFGFHELWHSFAIVGGALLAVAVSRLVS